MSITTISRDALTHIMAFVHKDADWSRLMATGCHEFAHRLLAVKPEQLSVSLDRSSVYLLQQMAVYRQQNPRLDTWPRHVEFVTTQTSSSTAFMVLLMPLIVHCQTASTVLQVSVEDDEGEVPFFRPEHTWSKWQLYNNKKCNESLQDILAKNTTGLLHHAVNVSRQEAAIIAHLPFPESQQTWIRECLGQSVVSVDSMTVNITTGLVAPTLTKLSLVLPCGWETSFMTAWFHIICHAPCLDSVRIKIESVDHSIDRFELPWIKSPYLKKLSIDASSIGGQLNLMLPDMPSLRKLSIKARHLYFTPPPTPYELTFLRIWDENDYNSSCINEICNTALLEKLDLSSSTGKHELNVIHSAPLLTDLTLFTNTFTKYISMLPDTLTRLSLIDQFFSPILFTYPKDLTPLIEPLRQLKHLELKQMRMSNIITNDDETIDDEKKERYLNVSRLPKGLVSLNLSENWSIECLPMRLDEWLPSLVSLSASSCALGRSKTLDWVTTLPDTLRHLDMFSCDIKLSRLARLDYLPPLQTLNIGGDNHLTLRAMADNAVQLLDTDFVEMLPCTLRQLRLPPIQIEGRLPTIVVRSTTVLKTLIKSGVLRPLCVKPDGESLRQVIAFDAQDVKFANQSFDQLQLGPPDDTLDDDKF